MASRKITELSALTATSADDLIIVVDMAGPTTYKMTVADFCNNIPANTRFSANVTMTQGLSGNSATFSANVDVNTANYLNANNLILKKNNTPASTTTVVAATTAGMMWSDGSYIYVQANATHVKRVAISTW